jgi:hypothetical protein
MGVFENRVLTGIFGTKRDGVATECRELHKEERNCVLRQILSRPRNHEDCFGLDESRER